MSSRIRNRKFNRYWWLCLLRNQERHVWAQGGRIHILSKPDQASNAIWLWTNAVHSRIVAPQNTTYHIHIGNRWLRDKHFSDNDRDHLLNALKVHYNISIDLTGTGYCCLTITWNYSQQYVDILIPGYVTKVLHKFQHLAPKKPQYAPHTWTSPTYGQKIQYALPDT